MLLTYIDPIAIIGFIAASATIIQIICGQGGQLMDVLSLRRHETDGINMGMWATNTASHACWALYGYGTESLVILLPNMLGCALSFMIVLRLNQVRSSRPVIT